MSDTVDHPAHYMSLGATCAQCGYPIECIQIVERMSFSLGNVIKYCWRSNHKNGLEDLQKAQWYLAREIARLEKEAHEA